MVYYLQEVRAMLKRIFCRHDYWLFGIVTFGNREHEVKEMICRCSKCGKEKSLKFKKELDKFKEL